MFGFEVARRIEDGEPVAHFFAVSDHGCLYADHVARAVECFAVIEEKLQVGDGDEVDFVVGFEDAQAVSRVGSVVVSDDVVGGDAIESVAAAAECDFGRFVGVLFIAGGAE